MKLRHIRHATHLIEYNGEKILVDPVFSPAGAMTPIQDSADSRRNPLVDLPVDEEELMESDAVLITHTHRDHFDDVAAQLLPREVPVFCQPEDEDKLSKAGFFRLHSVYDHLAWRSITVTRTGGRHGTGDLARRMGPVSGYVLSASGEPTVYIAGDTVWCPEVEAALAAHRPDVVILYGGSACFNYGDPITMGAADVIAVAHACPEAEIVVIHMEAFNHCGLTRSVLAASLGKENLLGHVHMPADGALVAFKMAR